MGGGGWPTFIKAHLFM